MTAALALLSALPVVAASKDYQLLSPSRDISLSLSVGETINYSLSAYGTLLIDGGTLSMSLSGGETFGLNDKVRKAAYRTVDGLVPAPVYKKSQVKENFNELRLSFKEFSLVLRAYNDGVAYRFESNMPGAFEVLAERADFRFAKDWNVYAPYVRPDRRTSIESQFYNSFENTYEHTALSKWDPKAIAFLPLTVEADGGIKVCITESGLLDYPGMYLHNGDASSTLTSVYAPYPKEIKQGGHNMLQGEVKSRENYIAKAAEDARFPWRAIIIAKEDKDLLDTDIPWLLGEPCANEADFAWVKPGKVAWDWWNDWNLYGVDFRAGINNDTYKYYIDFAAANGIAYVIMDEGWAVNLKADLFQVIPEIDLPMICKYAESKGVGIILWAGYWAFNRDIEGVCKTYSEMGVKGFKVDFMDRDDQPMIAFYRKAAETAAKYHMLLDFHGTSKPVGLHRTYPNVINYEGVNGLEQLKWAASGYDQVTYDVTIPFARMVAGPMDYTQGAMRNATRYNFRSVNTEGMSQGTRCRQLAEYVVFDSPFNMLCDSPSNYLAEPECTAFIASCPETWDETVPVDGKIAQYVAVARRKGDTWYVGAMTGWDARDLELDLSFIGGTASVEIFKDGINADRAARDFKHETVEADLSRPLKIHMAPGGGFAAIIRKK